jgi:hypothetical protein
MSNLSQGPLGPVHCPNNSRYSASFEVLTSVVVKIKVFWDVTLCHWVNLSRRFEGSEWLLHGQAAHLDPKTQHNITEDIELRRLRKSRS